jgi:hypothetical protein
VCRTLRIFGNSKRRSLVTAEPEAQSSTEKIQFSKKKPHCWEKAKGTEVGSLS